MRVSSERGFTLVELLVTMFLSGIIASAALTLLTRAQVAERDIADRSDATASGRLAIEAAARSLRSMSCLADGARPIVFASNDQVTFYADLDADTTYDPEKWQLSAVRSSGVLTGIREDRWVGITAPVPVATAANRTRILADDISARVVAGVEQPLFSYASYADNASVAPTPMGLGTIAAGDLQRVAQIDIGFSSEPASNRAVGRDVASHELTSVYARTVQRNGEANIPTYDCTS